MSVRLVALLALLTACSRGSTQSNPDGSTIGPDLATGLFADGASFGDLAVQPVTSGISITVEPDGTKVAQNLLDAMESAHAAVHVTMYLLTSDTYVNALTTLHSKGIEVKVVLNETFPSGTTPTNSGTYATLKSAGVDVVYSPTTTGFDAYTHEKAVIIDPYTSNAQAWIMTMNLDTSAPKYNREYLALDTLSDDIAEAEAIFQADFAGTSITPSGALIVAPSPQNNAQARLLALVSSATTSIDLELEEYSNSGIEADIATALVKKAKAGVAVRMVLEDSTDSSQASAVKALQTAGAKVVGYAYNGTALDIHAKAIVVDGQTAFIGSENLSGGSLGYNRELGVIFATPSEVQKVASAIAADFAGGSTYSSQ